MECMNYYHLFANGRDAQDLIRSEQDYYYQMNLVAICSNELNVEILAFSLEDTHPHFLLYGTYEECDKYMRQFRASTLRHISMTRGGQGNVVLNFDMMQVTDDSYLKNVASYIIVQPTKDGKSVMYYDYLWGSGSMYFRPVGNIPIWCQSSEGQVLAAKQFSQLTAKEKRMICGRHVIPDKWLVCNGLILPTNYVNVKMYEEIFVTHNCFRTFAGASAKAISQIHDQMSKYKGILMTDQEAREICNTISLELFGTHDFRKVNLSDRISIARLVRQRYNISVRQLSTILSLPDSEIRCYL